MFQRKPVVHLLKRLGFSEVGEAENCAEALIRLRTEPHDCVICSRDLPKPDGLALLKTIRKDPELKRLPVLLIFQTADQEQIVPAARAGMDGYLVRPFALEDLENMMRRTLPVIPSA